MPIMLPPKARAKAIQHRKHQTITPTDWLALWALSLGFCALVLAAIADIAGSDNIGASR
jgi:hypothetical protein